MTKQHRRHSDQSLYSNHALFNALYSSPKSTATFNSLCAKTYVWNSLLASQTILKEGLHTAKSNVGKPVLETLNSNVAEQVVHLANSNVTFPVVETIKSNVAKPVINTQKRNNQSHGTAKRNKTTSKPKIQV